MLELRRRICGLRSGFIYFFNIPRILLNSIKCISNSIIYYILLPTSICLVGTINCRATTS